MTLNKANVFHLSPAGSMHKAGEQIKATAAPRSFLRTFPWSFPPGIQLSLPNYGLADTVRAGCCGFNQNSSCRQVGCGCQPSPTKREHSVT